MLYNVKISKSSAGSSTARQPIQKASGWIGPRPPTRPEPRHHPPRYVRFVELSTPPRTAALTVGTPARFWPPPRLFAPSLQPWPACHGPAPREWHAEPLRCAAKPTLGWLYHVRNHAETPPNLSPPPGPCRERSRATEKSLSISTLTPTPNPQTPTPNPNPNAVLIQALIGRLCHLGWSAMFAGMRAYGGLRPMTTYIGVKVPISPPATSPSCACRSISRTLPEPLGAMPTNSMKLSTMFIMKVPQ